MLSRWHHHDISDQMQDTGNEAGIPTIGQMIAELERSALDVSRLEFKICTFGNP